MTPGSILEPLRASEPNTFARYTVIVRIPEIGSRILAENEFSPETTASIQALLDDLPRGCMRRLTDTWAPDAEAWDGYVEPYLGQDWLEVPWFFAETYFYRRIAEAVSFFREDGTQGDDPFALQKRLGLETTRTEIAALARLGARLAHEGWHPDRFAELLHLDLWGNQADLSMWPAEGGDRPRHEDAEMAAAHLLADEAAAAAKLVDEARHESSLQIDIVFDNAGFELIGDLVLADYILTSLPQAHVNLHVKLHPTFVSDAMTIDVRNTINFLRAEREPSSIELGSRLMRYLIEGRLNLHDNPFWTSPLAGWEMPESLREQLAAATLVISKGDANYRRFLGDRHWDCTTPFEEAVDYMPAPFLALRTMKSEILVGLTPGASERLYEEDEAWMTNGRRGVIQMAAWREA